LVVVSQDFPLYSEGTESTRFAYAIFLLNKDIIQMLNAHGMEEVGPRQTLQNLQRLMNLANLRKPVKRDFNV